MPKRRLMPPPEDLQWCVKCRKVLGDHGGWYGGQCFCDQLAMKREAKAHDPWGMPPT